MKMRKNIIINHHTKEAWQDNWENVSVERIMEIFSYPRVQKQLELFLRYLPKDKKVLEGGCGIGPYLLRLRSLGYKMIGLDYNYPPLKKIQEFDGSVPVYCADVSRLPFQDAQFGGYLSLGVLEHFSEGPHAAIKEAHRVLIDGGYFLVQVPQFSLFHCLQYPFTRLKRSKLVRRLFGKSARKYYWEQYFKVSTLSALLSKSGFEVELVIPLDHDHALMSLSGIFRDKSSYDNANTAGIFIGRLCAKLFPWKTAAGILFVCKKRKPNIEA